MRRALIRLLAWKSRQLSRAASLFAYAVAGAMRMQELRRTIEAEWDGYGRDGWASYAELGQWEREFYLAALEPGEKVLLVGCGTGRDLLGLTDAGLRVDGLDIAKRALAACRERVRARGIEARLYDCAVEEAALEGGYDAAVFTWFGYGYVPESERRVATLRALRAALVPGGRVLITYQRLNAGVSRVPVALARLVSRLTGSDWRPEPGDYVEVSRGTGADPALHFEHRFTPDEIVGEAARAGFGVLRHEHHEEGRLVLEKRDPPA